MNGYFKISGWLALSAAFLLLLWGAQTIGQLVFGLILPGGDFLTLFFLAVSFLLYELGMINLALLQRRSGARRSARLFTILWILPPAMIAVFVVMTSALADDPMTGFIIVTLVFLGYALLMGYAGYRMYLSANGPDLARVGVFLMLAGAIYAAQSIAGLAGTAAPDIVASTVVFWIMIAGGACVAGMQFSLGRGLIGGAAQTVTA